MEDACMNPKCSAHAREDVSAWSRIPGTDVETFMGVTYIDQYAVYTQGNWSPVQLVSIALLEAIALSGGEVKAREAVETMPSNKFLTPEQMFQVEYGVNVIEVGHGSLSDSAIGSEDWKEGVVKYANATSSAEEAIKLHDELVVMINAGTFNGENL